MDSHVKEYYRAYSDETPQGHFHKVIALHDAPDIDWKEISKKVPNLNKGWYELAHLPVQDRIDFSRDYWLSKLPYHPNIQEFLNKFFESFDDIGVFIIQPKFEDPFEVHLVYSLKDDSGFFHGYPPATESEILSLQKEFPDFILPADYTAFLQIHNGFSKSTDTGIIPAWKLLESFKNFQSLFERGEPLFTTKGDPVNPQALIPFYESFGMPFFQCFWEEWYPDQEMGNVYYSGLTNTISDYKSGDAPTESMAFPTFLDWLMFYLEKIE